MVGLLQPLLLLNARGETRRAFYEPPSAVTSNNAHQPCGKQAEMGECHAWMMAAL